MSRSVNNDAGAAPTAILTTLPLTIPGLILVMPMYGVSLALKDGPASVHRVRGDAARNRGDMQEAVEEYSLAVWRGEKSALDPLSEVWLEQGRTTNASYARRLLVCASGNLGADKWTRLEKWLAENNAPVASCKDDSTTPVQISWLE